MNIFHRKFTCLRDSRIKRVFFSVWIWRLHELDKKERHEDGTFVRLIAYSIDHQGETRMRQEMIPF